MTVGMDLRRPFGVFCAAAITLAPRLAPAASPSCASLPNPVVVAIDDVQEPLIKEVGQKLRASMVNPITLVYDVERSCQNLDTAADDTKLTKNPLYIPSAAEMPGWDPSQPSPPCTVDPSGATIDLFGSAVLPSTCTETVLPPTFTTQAGAVHPFVFVVPLLSNQRALTAEEAYFVFGFGAAGEVDPWTDETHSFIQGVTSAAGQGLGPLLRVPAAKWHGAIGNNENTMNAVVGSDVPVPTIGVVDGSAYEPKRDLVTGLAFRTFQQLHAYYPDATATSRDKQNVRDGHYVLWTSDHWVYDASASPRASYVADVLTGTAAVPTPDFDPLATTATVGLVPRCAMTVDRSEEGGDLFVSVPTEPCGCAFESLVGTPSDACAACTDDGPCGTGKCRHGFCEAH